MIIKESNNWKLIKENDYHLVELPSGERVKFSSSNSDYAKEYFDRVVDKGWTWLDRTYYIPSVKRGKIVISKESSSHVRSDKVDVWENGKYLTKEAANAAIEAVLPKALDHFKVCNERLKKLQVELSFSVGFNYDGDTHGIYDEYDYISFKMDNFDFQFEIE